MQHEISTQRSSRSGMQRPLNDLRGASGTESFTAEASACRTAGEALKTLQDIKAGIIADQKETEILGRQIDAKLARIRERLTR